MRSKAEDARTTSFGGAFDELYPLAVRLAARILGNQHEAEDVAAEALARACARWEHVGSLPYREAWVLRVASNLAIDAIRRRRAVEIPALNNAFEDQAALRLTLATALGALPRRQREAVVLRHLAGYQEAEVATILGISQNSVKTHLRRALALLRVRLRDTDLSGGLIAAP